MNPTLSKYGFYYPITLARGERVARYLKRYRRSQWLDSADLQALQLAHLRTLLSYVERSNAYYREVLAGVSLSAAGLESMADLRRLPTLSKADVVNFSEQMTSTKRSMWCSTKTTGGSTGEAVSIVKNADALARERAATWRGYGWAGVGIGDVQARFWGVPLASSNRHAAKLTDFVSNRSRLSAFDINHQSMDRYYRKLLRLKPAYLYGYASVINAFAEFVIGADLPPLPSLVAVITTSEVLDDSARSTIEQAFAVRVFNEYGCGEVGSIAHECERGSMHLMAENLIVEVEGEIDSPAGPGELLVTDLHNLAMPLIRYRVGDFATLSDRSCPCGRALPVLDKVHGRAYDVIVSPDGNQFHPEVMMYIFEDLKQRGEGVRQFQVVQREKTQLLVRLVVDQEADASRLEQMITQLIHAKVHPGFTVDYEYADTILREKSGKLRLIKSEVLRM